MSDEIVVKSLQEYYILCSEPNKIDCSDDIIEPDEDLLWAIDRVLADYMDPDSYYEWKNDYGSGKMITTITRVEK